MPAPHESDLPFLGGQHGGTHIQAGCVDRQVSKSEQHVDLPKKSGQRIELLKKNAKGYRIGVQLVRAGRTDRQVSNSKQHLDLWRTMDWREHVGYRIGVQHIKTCWAH